MFALAAYDQNKQQLLLARDRLGIKQIYLALQDDLLIFASERRAIPGSDQLNPQMIAQMLTFGHTATPPYFQEPNESCVVSMPAGLVVRINQHRPHDPVRYWPPQPRPNWSPLPIKNRTRACTFLRQQIEEVIQQQILTDLPVACLLSSGLESAIVTGLTSRLKPGKVCSFTLALQGTPQDENRVARRLAKHYGTEHHELEIAPDQALVLLTLT